MLTKMQRDRKLMILTAIAAMAENYTIGCENRLPWHMPADLKHFKSITAGHPIIMGRKTYISIGRALPNRTNIIITHDESFRADGCVVTNTIGDALSIAEQHTDNEAFVIGGAEIYRQLMPKIQRLYLTIVHHEFDGDAYFPTLMPGEWKELTRERHSADIDNPFEYSFVTMERVNATQGKRVINTDDLVTLR